MAPSTTPAPSSRPRLRRLLRFLPALLVMALAGFSAVPASAGEQTLVDIECLTGSHTNTYAPPLTNTTTYTTTQADETFTCTSLLGANVTGATSQRTFSGNFSCLLSTTPPLTPQTVTYQWNDGRSSTVTYTVNSSSHAADGTLLITKVGTVTAGLGAGQTATTVVASPSLDLASCAGAGITSLTGIATLAIAPL
jgi:hypothetical protein